MKNEIVHMPVCTAN